MTAIAYRDGVLAADTGAWQGILLAGRQEKITRLADGRLIACAGRVSECLRLIDKLNGADVVLEKVERDAFAALIVGPHKNDVMKVEYDFIPFPAPSAPFYAIGASFEFLIGAMAAGASAHEAIALAIKHTDSAFGEVTVARLL